MFQSPISGVNDWNCNAIREVEIYKHKRFSLLLAELMIGTRVIEREFDYEEMGFSLLLAELMIGTLKPPSQSVYY